MKDYSSRIKDLDQSLFDPIYSETSDEDKRSLLLLQNCVRDTGSYAYLEIGSHLGGSIQPYYVDTLCSLIYSVDKRPPLQPDQRGRNYEYPENSSTRMLNNLEGAFPSITNKRIRTFDCDAKDIDHSAIVEKPSICFIDGEHTISAVYSDFKFCLDVCEPNSVICFHDSNYIFQGISRIKEYLSRQSVVFATYQLRGSVYAILLNDAVETFSNKLEHFSLSESDYFRRASKDLFRIRLRNRWPLIHQALRLAKRAVISLTRRTT